MKSFAWQDGYGAFTVSKSNIPDVAAYIRGQREHHQSRSYLKAYLALLNKHEIQYEVRYLWD